MHDLRSLRELLLLHVSILPKGTRIADLIATFGYINRRQAITDPRTRGQLIHLLEKIKAIIDSTVTQMKKLMPLQVTSEV